jgi:hypothetical protein
LDVKDKGCDVTSFFGPDEVLVWGEERTRQNERHPLAFAPRHHPRRIRFGKMQPQKRALKSVDLR